MRIIFLLTLILLSTENISNVLALPPLPEQNLSFENEDSKDISLWSKLKAFFTPQEEELKPKEIKFATIDSEEEGDVDETKTLLEDSADPEKSTDQDDIPIPDFENMLNKVEELDAQEDNKEILENPNTSNASGDGRKEGQENLDKPSNDTISEEVSKSSEKEEVQTLNDEIVVVEQNSAENEEEATQEKTSPGKALLENIENKETPGIPEQKMEVDPKTVESTTSAKPDVQKEEGEVQTPNDETLVVEQNSAENEEEIPEIKEEATQEKAPPEEELLENIENKETPSIPEQKMEVGPKTVEPAISAKPDVRKMIEKFKRQAVNKQENKQQIPQLSYEELKQVNSKDKTDNRTKSNSKFEIEFVENETKMLILPQDEIILGELSDKARYELMDMTQYIQVFWDNYEKIKEEQKSQEIKRFIDAILDM